MSRFWGTKSGLWQLRLALLRATTFVVEDIYSVICRSPGARVFSPLLKSAGGKAGIISATQREAQIVKTPQPNMAA